MFCLTESAPFTTQEISITGKGKVCGRLQNFIGPLIQVILADFAGRNVLTSGLVDGHADRIDVIDVIEELQSAKGVALHLRIVLSGYEDSKTVFVVNYMHGAVADENGIRSSEALFYPTGEVHSLFNQNNRVGASLLGLFQKLHDEADIPGGTVIHFSVIPAEILGRICSFHAECFTELVLTKRVGIGAFCSIVAAFILVSFAEPC